MTEHSYGWIKDKFNMAAVYHEPVVKVLPPSTNNRIYFPTVQNQDGVGICGGFSWAEHINAVCKQIGQPVDRFSENWNYNGCRFIMGTLTQDSGVTNDDVILWLTRNGFLVYPYWPFLDIGCIVYNRVSELWRVYYEKIIDWFITGDFACKRL